MRLSYEHKNRVWLIINIERTIETGILDYLFPKSDFLPLSSVACRLLINIWASKKYTFLNFECPLTWLLLLEVHSVKEVDLNEEHVQHDLPRWNLPATIPVIDFDTSISYLYILEKTKSVFCVIVAFSLNGFLKVIYF